MNEKEKAEAYVRTKLPELMELSFGCRGVTNDRTWVMMQNGNWVIEDSPLDSYSIFEPREIIGHPIQLQQWLQALDLNSTDEQTVVKVSANMMRVETWAYSKSFVLLFNLATGQPATEADYQAFNQIIGNI
jgi:hypothetical protein